MSDITIITPPDILNNDVLGLLLIFPSTVLKNDINRIVSKYTIPINIFLYETQEPDLKWLLTQSKKVDYTILDIDNCDLTTRTFVSHLVAQSNTFYLTKDNVTPYNIISKNKFYDLSWLENILINNDRGHNE
jgi:hypothetical protein|tara:strand:+ start:439 stop:834 length:396 start_codon:yes stop_codon:yes gene_type:complete